MESFINTYGNKKIKDIIGILHNYLKDDRYESHIELESLCIIHKTDKLINVFHKIETLLSF